jgi:hypothetical protein
MQLVQEAAAEDLKVVAKLLQVVADLELLSLDTTYRQLHSLQITVPVLQVQLHWQ